MATRKVEIEVHVVQRLAAQHVVPWQVGVLEDAEGHLDRLAGDHDAGGRLADAGRMRARPDVVQTHAMGVDGGQLLHSRAVGAEVERAAAVDQGRAQLALDGERHCGAYRIAPWTAGYQQWLFAGRAVRRRAIDGEDIVGDAERAQHFEYVQPDQARSGVAYRYRHVVQGDRADRQVVQCSRLERHVARQYAVRVMVATGHAYAEAFGGGGVEHNVAGTGVHHQACLRAVG